MNISELSNYCCDLIQRSNKTTSYVIDVNTKSMAHSIDLVLNGSQLLKDYSEIGFFRKLFLSDIEISANKKIAIMDIESGINKCEVESKKLEKIIEELKSQIDRISNIQKEIESDIPMIEQYIVAHKDSYDIGRISNHLNDIHSLVLMNDMSIKQTQLSISNSQILIDKFKSIKSVLLPSLSVNINFEGNT